MLHLISLVVLATQLISVFSETIRPSLSLQITSAELHNFVSEINRDANGCETTGHTAVSYLKVTVTVTNTGVDDYIPSPLANVNCFQDWAIMNFYKINFPGGPYFKFEKCLFDTSSPQIYSCPTNLGVSAGNYFDATLWVKVNQLSTNNYFSLNGNSIPFTITIIPSNSTSNSFTISKPLTTLNIITVAGSSGNDGNSGDGGPATSATFYGVNSVSVSSNGDYYILDASSFRIRKVISSSNAIQHYAGSLDLSSGYSIDGTLASSAKLSPLFYSAIAVHPTSGDVYVTDCTNQVIRRISSSSGTLSTVAGIAGGPVFNAPSGDGGSATAASLYYPSALWVAASGNVYTGGSGFGIRKVTASTGLLSTVVPGAATYASSIFVDSAEQLLYWVDHFNMVVHRCVLATGVVSLVAGNYKMQSYSPLTDGKLATEVSLHNPFGVTVSPITGMIYISDLNAGIVRKVDPSTGIITTPIGVGQGVVGPAGMWFTPTGQLYIADHGGRTIVKVVDFE